MYKEIAMKKMLVFLTLLVWCISGIALADGNEDFTLQQVSQCTNYVASIESITDSNTTVTLFTAPYVAKAIYVENLGDNEAWVDFDDGLATAGTEDEIRLDPAGTRSLSGFKTSTIGIVASTGEATTVQVEACR